MEASTPNVNIHQMSTYTKCQHTPKQVSRFCMQMMCAIRLPSRTSCFFTHEHYLGYKNLKVPSSLTTTLLQKLQRD
jgi:hypothetical protein